MVTREDLIANGFKPTTYEGQEGEFLAKLLKANAMPYFLEHVVDGENVFEDDMIVVEVGPDWTVQLVNQDVDYYEEAVPVDSDEGRALLRDAGFPI